MEKKIKVCMVANSLEVNGVSNVIMNYCRNIDLNSFAVSIILRTVRNVRIWGLVFMSFPQEEIIKKTII